MKKLVTLTLSFFLFAGMAFADGRKEPAPRPAQPAKPEATKKNSDRTAASFETELEELRRTLESQQQELQLLREQLARRDRQIDDAQQAAATSTARAADPRGKAGEPGSGSAELRTSAATLGSKVTDLTAKTEALKTSVASAPSASVPAAARTTASVAKPPSAQAGEGKLSDLAYGKIKIGATFYGDWAYYTDTGFGPQFLTQLNQNGPGNSGFNSFDVTRTYLNFLYTPNDDVTLRLTPNIYRQVDVSGATGNGIGSGIASSSHGNLGFRLKYAYAQFNTLFKGSDAFKKDNLRVGQQMNPLIDWEEGLWGYRYVSLVPWNYLSLSSTYTGVALNGPIEFNGREYLDYQIGAFNTASFHAIETNDKKQGMVRLTWYPLGTTSDRTGLGVTGFEDYGYNTKTPDTKSTPLNRLAVLVHYQTHSKGFLVAGEYDLGRNAFSTGNLFSGASPGDLIGLGPTPYATFSSLSSALLAGDHTRQQGFDFFGHVRLGHSPFSLFGFYQYFQPNTKISGTNPLDFARTVGGISYKYNDHFEFSFDDQNLNYFHKQFTMTPAQIATFSPSLAAANPGGIPNAVPNGTNAFFINLLFNY